jgi:hypothetical protein
MNPPSLKTRIACKAASILASALITFTGVHLIAGYGLPSQPASGVTLLAAAYPASDY